MPSLLPRLLDLAVAIQQIPAPTGEETARAAFVKERFAAEGLAVETDAVGNVYARLPGASSARPVVVSAHLDTVFPANTPLAVQRDAHRIAGPGIGDNSVAVAALLGLVWLLRVENRRLPTDLWLVANVGEEGLGNLKGMKSIVARFGAQARAYIVLEGLGLGWVYPRALGVRRYALTVRTAGGHAWANAGSPSAIHTLAALITRLEAQQRPRETSFNVGTFHGGVSINTIAPEARAEIDLRAVHADALEALAQRLEAEAHRARQPGVEITWEHIGDRPTGSLPLSHPLVQAALTALRRRGLSGRTAVASTDANIPLSRGYPAICLGLTTGGGAHTLKEFIHTRPLSTGLAVLAETVVAASRL